MVSWRGSWKAAAMVVAAALLVSASTRERFRGGSAWTES